MGTNFYWRLNPLTLLTSRVESPLPESDDLESHIGKRSAAGPYCWNCGTTLCMAGTDSVHHTGRQQEWLTECPSCHAKPMSPNEIGSSPVRSCCSFTWTLGKHEKTLRAISLANIQSKCVADEYGEQCSANEMLAITDGCPIQFQCPERFS